MFLDDSTHYDLSGDIFYGNEKKLMFNIYFYFKIHINININSNFILIIYFNTIACYRAGRIEIILNYLFRFRYNEQSYI